jgi:hypothetical protein
MRNAHPFNKATLVADNSFRDASMATTDLKLDEPGTLPRSGPVGRIARLAFGGLCLWYAVNLIQTGNDLLGDDGHIKQVVWNGIVFGLFLVSYVINIGFSVAWKKWPAFVSAGVMVLIAGFGLLTQGSIESNLLARVIWGWELYVFSHLGLAFVVSSVIGSAGCEMRAFHELYSRITGIPTKEHYCPIGPLHSLDQWESRHAQR